MSEKRVPIAVWASLNLRHIELCAEHGIDRIYPSITPGCTTHPAFPEPTEGFDADRSAWDSGCPE